MRRRDFLRLGLGLGVGLGVGATTVASPWRQAMAAVFPGDGPYGPLLPPNELGAQLPAGFSARVVASSGFPVPPSGVRWHVAPDGGATFRARDGWIYVSNSEASVGGVGALRFDLRGEVVDAYPILEGTRRNCAGGATPWGTWLSCEEVPAGLVYECDPTGRREAIVRPALGTFNHEAVCYDLASRAFYLTEDRRDGRFYRFLPNAAERLDSGVLQAAAVDAEGRVTWHDIPEPNPNIPARETPTRHQVPETTPFAGGEGIVVSRGHVYFTTKRDDRVWEYDPRRERISILYDPGAAPGLALSGVDNITADGGGDLIVAEDGGNMELVLITRAMEVAPILRLPFHRGSELAGPAFDPSGSRLYVSSQRAGFGRRGLTYEITGPFDAARGRRLGLR